MSTGLKELFAARRAFLLLGATDALSARVIEDCGFEALYLSGAGFTNARFGMPDHGFVGLKDLCDGVFAIRNAVNLPVLVDADTGFGNAVNVHHTVRLLETAGAGGIQIEDQVSPKKCGHFAGKAVVPVLEMIGKIKAAVDARRNDDVLVVARTDARAVDGFQAAIDRACAYVEAGADVIFVEAPREVDEIVRLPTLIQVPQIVNMVIGGKTPQMTQADLANHGFGAVLYANAALQGAVLGMTRALAALKSGGILLEDPALVAPFAERQRLVNKPTYDALEARFASD